MAFCVLTQIYILRSDWRYSKTVTITDTWFIDYSSTSADLIFQLVNVHSYFNFGYWIWLHVPKYLYHVHVHWNGFRSITYITISHYACCHSNIYECNKLFVYSRVLSVWLHISKPKHYTQLTGRINMNIQTDYRNIQYYRYVYNKRRLSCLNMYYTLYRISDNERDFKCRRRSGYTQSKLFE